MYVETCMLCFSVHCFLRYWWCHWPHLNNVSCYIWVVKKTFIHIIKRWLRPTLRAASRAVGLTLRYRIVAHWPWHFLAAIAHRLYRVFMCFAKIVKRASSLGAKYYSYLTLMCRWVCAIIDVTFSLKQVSTTCRKTLAIKEHELRTCLSGLKKEITMLYTTFPTNIIQKYNSIF